MVRGRKDYGEGEKGSTYTAYWQRLAIFGGTFGIGLSVLDIQPPKTMNSLSRCKDKLRVFLVLSGNPLSMTLVPQDIYHSSKVKNSWWKKMGWCLRCKHAPPQTPEISTMN
jgi:hypothetical protein